MIMATLGELKYSVKDAAERFGRNASRIRQICIEYDIGFKFDARSDRRLTERDMSKIGRILDEIGRPRKSKKVS